MALPKTVRALGGETKRIPSISASTAFQPDNPERGNSRKRYNRYKNAATNHKIEKAKLLGSLGTLLLQAPILDATLQKFIVRLSELDSEWSSETVCAYSRMV